MRNLLLVTVCALVSGCLQSQVQIAPGPGSEREAKGVNSDCYTVNLFNEARIEKPAPDVPEAHRRFLGKWGAGAWNDFWCHDLVVTKVEAGGRVELIEMLAPYAPWNYPATAFKRTAQIDDEGNLRFAYGTERLSYHIENGKLIGTRSGLYGNLRVRLVRRGVPPVPAPKPIRLTQLGAAPEPGS